MKKEVKTEKPGNAAAMREALEQIADMGERIDNQLGSSEETVYALRNERCIAHNISECARSALSAPPRNCDRPECATTKSAQDTWRKEDGGRTAYYEWLLAASTRRNEGCETNNPGESERKYVEPRVHRTLLEAAEAMVDEWWGAYPAVSYGKIADLENAIAHEKSKPVRNCDRFATQEEAVAEFARLCDKGREPCEDVVTWLYENADKEKTE